MIAPNFPGVFNQIRTVEIYINDWLDAEYKTPVGSNLYKGDDKRVGIGLLMNGCSFHKHKKHSKYLVSTR